MNETHCKGCRDNFYNGHNPLGVKECWHRKSAKIVWLKLVPYSMRPPWNVPAQKLPECYHQEGYASINPKRKC